MPRKLRRARIAKPTIEKMARRFRAARREPSSSTRRNHRFPIRGKKHAAMEQRIKHSIKTPCSDEKRPVMIWAEAARTLKFSVHGRVRATLCLRRCIAAREDAVLLLAKSGCRLEWIRERGMNATVIHGEGLGKRYRRGGLQQSGLLRDQLSRALKSPLSVFRRPKDEIFWALKDVSLEVREGEVLGLIGRNGAGKTTLLKILSRITLPTTGWAEISGRVGTLLEVGT